MIAGRGDSAARSAEVLNDPAHAAALKRVVDGARGTRRFVDLISGSILRGYAGDLLALAQTNPENELGVQAVGTLLSQHEEARLAAALAGRDPQKVAKTRSACWAVPRIRTRAAC